MMHINIEIGRDFAPYINPRIGNVYPVRGGRGAREGYMQVLIAITYGQMALMLVVDKKGDPVGVTSYGMHIVNDLSPIAFVEGLDDLNLVMRSL